MIWYITLLISLPIMVVTLGGNIVFRISSTYVYHFNDTQVAASTGFGISEREFADEITGYFNSFGIHDFQIYEKNGEFEDPVFERGDITAMGTLKYALDISLLLCVLSIFITIGIYILLHTKGRKAATRHFGFGAIIIALILVLIEVILINTKSVQGFFIKNVLGINLPNESTVRVLLESPFEKTVTLFILIISFGMITVFTYVHYIMTKESRMFS